jgi:ribosome-associated protein
MAGQGTPADAPRRSAWHDASVSDVLPIRPGLAIPRAELAWRFSRSGGPGGQGVNTTDSRVELRWNLAASTALPPPLRERALQRLAGNLVDGQVVIVASEYRAQLANRRAAEARLVALLQQAVAAPPAERRPTRPSAGAVRRRKESKRQRSHLKQQRRPPAE